MSDHTIGVVGVAGPVAMTDVARRAGVSHQTVSRVLNQHPNVREETRNRVLRVIEELGYRPNIAARALASGRSQFLGVVTQDIPLYGPSSLLYAFEQAARARNFFVSVSSMQSGEPGSMRDAVQHHLNSGVAGLVLIAPLISLRDVVDLIPDTLPTVVIDGPVTGHHALVTVDQQAGARTATRYLLEAGHPTVWHVSGPPDWVDSQGRLEGWRQTLAEAGADIPPHLTGDWSAASGYRAGQLIARMPEVSAVFSANDHMALGLIRALHERGQRVPEDVSIVGFDDVPEAGYFTPPLTTVQPCFADVGRASLDILLRQIDEGRAVPTVRSIVPGLVIRASVSVR